MKNLTFVEMKKNFLDAYNLNDAIENIYSNEVISTILRRAGEFMCPCSPNSISSLVSECYQPLSCDIEKIYEKIKIVLQLLVGYGDFIESKDFRITNNDNSNLLFAAPSGFVKIQENYFLFFGIKPNLHTILPLEIYNKIKQYRR